MNHHLPEEEIVAYLLDQMNPEEQRAFEQRVKDHPQWQEEIERYRAILVELPDAFAEEIQPHPRLRRQLLQAELQGSLSFPRFNSRWVRWGSAGIAASLITTLGFHNYQLQQALVILQKQLAQSESQVALLQDQMSQPKTLLTVGNPLDKQLQDRPVLVDIYAGWCPRCKNIAPTLASLKAEYKDKIHIIVLDVTDHDTTNQALMTANQLGLAKFFAENKFKTSTVGIINPQTGEILQLFYNNPNKTDYEAAISSLHQQLNQ